MEVVLRSRVRRAPSDGSHWPRRAILSLLFARRVSAPRAGGGGGSCRRAGALALSPSALCVVTLSRQQHHAPSSHLTHTHHPRPYRTAARPTPSVDDQERERETRYGRRRRSDRPRRESRLLRARARVPCRVIRPSNHAARITPDLELQVPRARPLELCPHAPFSHPSPKLETPQRPPT